MNFAAVPNKNGDDNHLPSFTIKHNDTVTSVSEFRKAGQDNLMSFGPGGPRDVQNTDAISV